MNDKEMSELFTGVFTELKELNKNLFELKQELVKNSDLTHQNNILMNELKKIEINLGAVMAQGLSANANGALIERLAGFFIRNIK
jgi:hypothetical protein